MKYEKFEEWMLHVPVVTSNGDKGEITNSLVYDRAIVLLQDEAEVVSRICNLEFLEEKPSEEVGAQENSQINWEVGQTVWDTVHGKGEVDRVGDSLHYPVGVVFDNGDTVDYTLCGEVHEQAKRSLFFSEPVITAELFPPKKPFIPTLKKGQMVVIKGKNCFENGCLRYVHLEQEDRIYTEEDSYFLKEDIAAIYCVGEELKL